MPQLGERTIFGRLIPGLRVLDARKLEHGDALGHEIAFENVDRPAANQIATTEFLIVAGASRR
ncbi:hypothetical protein AU476_13635 [Cupriavidus sp. UYMSc13B]|nr:hypothetical protein AU476_13635 [Cupriavidus sp. UYMSc13B]